ncbi:hypothetical protein ACN20G_28190 (plasmid) [Streptomyces sp. BI20]|uniref:hypothetical protein n=1 Tax=Streptomyces sp. BI20 TaxID=3403460 RepID=UPI003C73E930
MAEHGPDYPDYDTRFEKIEAKQAAQERTLGEHKRQLGQFEQKLGQLEDQIPDTSKFATKDEFKELQALGQRLAQSVQNMSFKVNEQKAAIGKLTGRVEAVEVLTPTIRLRAAIGAASSGAVPVTLMFNAKGKTERWLIQQLHAVNVKELSVLTWRLLSSETQAPDEDGNDEKLFPGVLPGWSLFVVHQQTKRDGKWVTDDAASVCAYVPSGV